MDPIPCYSEQFLIFCLAVKHAPCGQTVPPRSKPVATVKSDNLEIDKLFFTRP